MFFATSNDAVGRLLEKSILELCRTSLSPSCDGIEVDALVCITKLSAVGKQGDTVVLKIHERILPEPTPPVPHEQAKKVNKRKSTQPVAIPQKHRKQNEDDSSGDDCKIEPRSMVNNHSPIECTDTRDMAYSPIGVIIDNGVACEPDFSPSPGGAELYVCEHCQVSFTSDTLYSEHIKQHDARPCFVCNKCGRTFCNSIALDFHLKTHEYSDSAPRVLTKSTPIRCYDCPKQVKGRAALVEHMRRDHGCSSYSCVTCNSVFRTFESFRKHRNLVHSNVNQCRCHKCDLFFTFTEINEHERECHDIPTTNSCSEHEQAQRGGVPDELSGRPLITIECEFDHTQDCKSPSTNVKASATRRSSTTTAHSVPGYTPPRSGGARNSTPDGSNLASMPCGGPYRCHICFKVFEEFELYETHNHEMHSRFVCSYCAMSFATKRNLQRHARRHTGIRPYRCADCTQSFTRDDDLRKHCDRAGHQSANSGHIDWKSVAQALMDQKRLSDDDLNADLLHSNISQAEKLLSAEYFANKVKQEVVSSADEGSNDP